MLGPNDSHVRVMSTKRHAPEERCFLKIYTSDSMLEVTGDHRVIGQCPQGVPVTLPALDMRPHIVTGVGAQPVERFDLNHRCSEVVEPVFEDDAPVLVWTRSGRRFNNTDLEHSFAVRGGLCDVYDLLNIRNGFFDGLRVSGTRSMNRSHSADTNMPPEGQRRLARSRARWPSPSANMVCDSVD